MLETILTQFAQTLWANAWADWNEELDYDDPQRTNVSGCEITEIMPEVPSNVNELARVVFARLANLNGGSEAFLRQCEAVCKRDKSDLEYLAHYLVMESMGHGVAYSDYYPMHGLQVLRYLEVHTFNGKDVDMSI